MGSLWRQGGYPTSTGRIGSTPEITWSYCNTCSQLDIIRGNRLTWPVNARKGAAEVKRLWWMNPIKSTAGDVNFNIQYLFRIQKFNIVTARTVEHKENCNEKKYWWEKINAILGLVSESQYKYRLWLFKFHRMTDLNDVLADRQWSSSNYKRIHI